MKKVLILIVVIIIAAAVLLFSCYDLGGCETARQACRSLRIARRTCGSGRMRCRLQRKRGVPKGLCWTLFQKRLRKRNKVLLVGYGSHGAVWPCRLYRDVSRDNRYYYGSVWSGSSLYSIEIHDIMQSFARPHCDEVWRSFFVRSVLICFIRSEQVVLF